MEQHKIYLSLNCDGVWIDYSQYATMQGFKRTVSLNENNDPSRSIGSDIEVFGDAYNFIYDNLILSSDRYSNRICIKYIDITCANDEYFFKVENENIRWCDNNSCQIVLSLIEDNPKVS